MNTPGRNPWYFYALRILSLGLFVGLAVFLESIGIGWFPALLLCLIIYVPSAWLVLWLIKRRDAASVTNSPSEPPSNVRPVDDKDRP